MKKVIGWSLALIAVFALVATFLTQKTDAKTSSQKTIVVATGGNPAPFSFTGSDGKLQGQNIDLVKAVFKKLPQYKLKIVQTEFSSIFTGLSSGRYQMGANNIAKNAEREANYLFSDPIFANSYVVIFNPKKDPGKQISSWSDLAGLSTVGSTGVNTSTAIESYNKENPDATISFNYSQEDLTSQLQAVESGKYDFLLMDKPMFEYYQKENDYELTSQDVSGDLAKELLVEPYSYFVFAKDQEELQKDVNEALKEVIEDGTSKKINEKYFGADYSPSYD
ncbi:transporter substrate-binding domain-containing protein [Streptococcus loxodontisalivarius]|uniref:Polar amino acid transport system substrate-binding protein n=1 Tax=Streptococcus loxodontisalivarius TaxID=1349415 RepID=A0ABS2PTV3_9STRE|nr:transporter substrate-binding domain-containing protein [Streptococcus loxodontisalivarius]MBM7642919.1 polar amino acid transport system substrate-binding protein [Streptococcus loxodontisalivarius]